MNIPNLLLLAIALLTLCCSGPKAEEEKTAASRLGEVHLEVTGAVDALPFFEKGLLLLHSFEYDDARAAFRKAQEKDPGFAMAYWGEAMTHNHGLWHRQDYEEARSALERLAPTAEERLEKANAGLERDFLQAVEILYGEGEKVERDKAYAAFMEKLYEKYPGNHEVASFYALSLLGAVPVGRDEEAYGKGASIAGGILKENPNHPGALHYLIHSYDDPGHAHLAKKAADSYADVAPDAAHALHMPSHIYVALGMWHEVVASNEASYAASVKRMERKGLDNDARSYHAFHWLLYGYLQQGRVEEARRILDQMVEYTEELPSKSARSYLIRMKGNYLVETETWDGPVADIEVGLDELNLSFQAIAHFLEGMKAYRNKDAAKMESLLEEMAFARQQASMSVNSEGVPMCGSAGSYGQANQLDIDQAYIQELELKGLHAMLKGQPQEAERWFKKATEVEDNASYSYGPPEVVKPSYELYGEWLLEQSRPEDALKQFERALKRGPKRARALNGKLRAAEALGQEEEAKEARKLLEEIRAKAEAQRKGQLS
ncbi:MAG: tetratricopeptide repeat protein [Phaeodactylibacter sp.]|nr:tetratricopeptide repeat protein [Phaeodactylibacter sp.]MCB9298744.1 tetratricopeptide repeat protein [Lewinellaceae bacterium]